MKRPPKWPWIYTSLDGTVYDCRTKEEGRLEVVKDRGTSRYNDRDEVSDQDKLLYEAAGRAHEIIICMETVRASPRPVHLALVERMIFRMRELHDCLQALDALVK